MGGHRARVYLPFPLNEFLAQWASLRTKMISRPAPEFTREEWAYLITFLDPHALNQVFREAFGDSTDDAGLISAVFRPRGPIALWLPNNASLLGPLTLILLSLCGSPVRAKAGSRAEDLGDAFVQYARRHLAHGSLRSHLEHRVHITRFDRTDARNAEMSANAAIRIVFGSDEAVRAVDALPHRSEARFFGFGDHVSEAWVHPDRLDDATVSLLGRVFVIYGRAGCTSPARVVILDGTPDDAAALQQRLLANWKRIQPKRPAPHIASQNIVALQLARAQGWKAECATDNSAALLAGDLSLPPIPGMLVLPIVPASLADAIRTLPRNIQTIGHLLREPADPALLRAISATRVKRFVPLRQMHHFGPVWDGFAFWRELFEPVGVAR
jgi:hypothetical protein